MKCAFTCASFDLQATRLCEELRQEQDRGSHLEKIKKNQEQNLRELTLRLEEAEMQALKAGKRTIQKLEIRVRVCLCVFSKYNQQYSI